MLELIVLSLGLSCVTAVASLILGKALAASWRGSGPPCT